MVQFDGNLNTCEKSRKQTFSRGKISLNKNCEENTQPLRLSGVQICGFAHDRSHQHRLSRDFDKENERRIRSADRMTTFQPATKETSEQECIAYCAAEAIPPSNSTLTHMMSD